MEIDVSRLLVAVAVMAVMFAFFAWGLSLWARKKGVAPSKGPRQLKLQETLYIDARNRICLIEQGDEILTLFIGPNSTELLNKKKKEEHAPK